ncbi:MAG: chalcone isomerase family protein [Acidobacteria bacterium]|nr:chalcone isomerase family protein [Acidobacteriota bacterium]MBI3658221.1 chalcone isomerase family protein [Acidobacteriota bacterium]
MTRILCATTLFLIALSFNVLAGELKGVSLPDQTTIEGKTVLLNGMGLREATMLKVAVYVAGLYLETKSSDPQAILDSDQVKRLDMRFVRDVKAGQMKDAWKESFEKNCPKPCTAMQERLSTLNSYMADLQHGDTMAFTFLPDRVEVHVKGKVMGSISGKDFSKILLMTWLGPHPPNKGLKEGMLGKK